MWISKIAFNLWQTRFCYMLRLQDDVMSLKKAQQSAFSKEINHREIFAAKMQIISELAPYICRV